MAGKKILLNELGLEQKRKGFVSKEKLKEIASKACVPESEAFSAATFYSFLSLEKRAKHSVLVCNCPSEQLKGSEKILGFLEKRLKVKRGNATKDKKFYLGETSCIGLCDKAPAMLVDGKPHAKVTIEKTKEILGKLK
ncbi:MAG: NAD(P)H-dependent oxidoreductase subunit E [Candidatus Diapherotrites archaeon]|nr:NAD(P)H-dependent oxidoreductase subunit E [Candidatus Diapherotrites archaeon]